MFRRVLVTVVLGVALAACGHGGARSVLPSTPSAGNSGGSPGTKSTNVALFDGTLWYGAGGSLFAVPLQSGGAPAELDGTMDGIVDPVPVAMTVAPDGTLYDLVSDDETNWQLQAYAPGSHGPSRPEETIYGTGYPQQIVLVGDGIDVLSTVNFNTSQASSTLWTFVYGAGNAPQPIRRLNLGANVTDAASDNYDRIYVARRGAGISVYSPAATCNCSPIRTIATGSRSNDAIAVSKDGIVYALSKDPASGSVTIDAYAPGNDGPTPTRTIGAIPASRGTPTGGITVDSDGKVYVNFRDARGRNSADVYAPTANGASPPLQTIPMPVLGGNVTSIAIGPTIPLGTPAPSGVLYVANRTLVNAFPLTASGPAAPQRSIDPLGADADGGPYTFITSIATAADGHLDVVREDTQRPPRSIAAEPANANGSAVPDYTIPIYGDDIQLARGPNGVLDVVKWDGSSGPSSLVDRYVGTNAQPGEIRTNYFYGSIATGPNGDIFLSGDQNHVYEYAANATSYGPPIRTITVPQSPAQLAVGPDGTVYAVGDQQNADGSSLTSTVYVIPPGQTSSTRSIGPFTDSGSGSRPFPIRSLAVDSANELYVAIGWSSGASEVDVFAPGASGNAEPVRTLLNPVSFGSQLGEIAIFQ